MLSRVFLNLDMKIVWGSNICVIVILSTHIQLLFTTREMFRSYRVASLDIWTIKIRRKLLEESTIVSHACQEKLTLTVHVLLFLWFLIYFIYALVLSLWYWNCSLFVNISEMLHNKSPCLYYRISPRLHWPLVSYYGYSICLLSCWSSYCHQYSLWWCK